MVYGILASGHNLASMAVAPLFSLLDPELGTYIISPLRSVAAIRKKWRIQYTEAVCNTV